MNIAKTRKQLLEEFDNRYIAIVLALTDDIYDIGEFTNDYLYFKPFYCDLIKKLLKLH